MIQPDILPLHSDVPRKKESLQRILETLNESHVLTDIEVNLLDRWAATAYRPRAHTADKRWVYRIYHEERILSCGFLNLPYRAAIDSDQPSYQQERAVIDRLTNLTMSFRECGQVVTDDDRLF